RYDPNCRKAQELLTHMRQPGYFNKTVDAGFMNKVEEVKRLLAEADGFYQSGQYDKAMKRYDQVLTLDPYNTAARRGQERISNTKYQYGEEAYNETRARDLWKVEEAWQQPVRKYGAVGPVADNKGRGGEVRGTAQMTNKMNSIIIPHVEFRDTTIREAIEFLREQAAESDPSGQGVNIVLRVVPLGQIAPPSVPVLAVPMGTGTPLAGAPAQNPPLTTPPPQAAPNGSPGVPPVPVVTGPAAARITVTLDNIPLDEALRYVAHQACVTVNEAPPVATNVIDKEAVSFQTYSGTGTGARATSQANQIQGTSTTRQTLLNDRQLVGRADAKTMLQSMGVSFQG